VFGILCSDGAGALGSASGLLPGEFGSVLDCDCSVAVATGDGNHFSLADIPAMFDFSKKDSFVLQEGAPMGSVMWTFSIAFSIASSRHTLPKCHAKCDARRNVTYWEQTGRMTSARL
jgi:hypothetical protein